MVTGREPFNDGGGPEKDEDASSGYPTTTIHRSRVAVLRAHSVDGPAAVGSRNGDIAARLGKL